MAKSTSTHEAHLNKARIKPAVQAVDKIESEGKGEEEEVKELRQELESVKQQRDPM